MRADLGKIIVEILREQAREGRKCTSKTEIEGYLRKRGLEPTRNTVGRHLDALLEDPKSGVKYELAPYTRTVIRNGKEEVQEIKKGYYYESEISDAELRYLIDCVLHSKVMKAEQGNALIEKLKKLSGKTIEDDTNYLANVKEEIYTDNKHTLKNVQILQDAIRNHRKVCFIFNGYNLEKKLEPKPNKVREFHPYQIVFSNGRYYLMAATDDMVRKNTYRLYRIDLLTEVEKTVWPAHDKRKVFDIYTNSDLIKLTRENPYMFTGKVTEITLRVKTSIIVQIVDWFGKDFTVVKGSETEETVDIKVQANPNAMLYWVLQYGLNVEVLSPKSFREEVKEKINEIKAKYDQNTGL